MAQSHKGKKIRSYNTEFKVEVVEWLRLECRMFQQQQQSIYAVDQTRVREWDKKIRPAPGYKYWEG